MATNRGKINILVYCYLVPKTGENFLELCESGYYNNTPFHRLVKDFCLQGGDPTGTGTGGNSIFERVFEDEFSEQLSHNKPGMVSMANSGPDTNLSQFFITLAECKQLDKKHTVFGEVIEGQSVLFSINKNASSKSEKPKEELFIEKMTCYENPYRKVIQELKEAYKKGQTDVEGIEK
jgi:peptidyl-prolyl cis-trans isomerase-like protein 2